LNIIPNKAQTPLGPGFYFVRQRNRTISNADVRWTSAATSANTGDYNNFLQSRKSKSIPAASPNTAGGGKSEGTVCAAVGEGRRLFKAKDIRRLPRTVAGASMKTDNRCRRPNRKIANKAEKYLSYLKVLM